MEDVDEICNGQHTCERKGCMFPLHSQGPILPCNYSINPSLPTNLCNLLSHNGAALKPFATSAKKAFFTFMKSEFHKVRMIILQENKNKERKRWFKLSRTAFLLVVWYQIWPVYSWLEWHHSSCDFSWNSCRLRHRPPWGSHYLIETWTREVTHTHTRLPTAQLHVRACVHTCAEYCDRTSFLYLLHLLQEWNLTEQSKTFPTWQSE